MGIVPAEILERRRKAFQLSAPLKALAAARQTIETTFTDSALEREGLIDRRQLLLWLERTASGDPTWWQALVRTVSLELWLQTLAQQHETATFQGSLEQSAKFDREPAISDLRVSQQTSW
jgi:asparagine synthase (glutamine-hydrolysing)